MPRFAIHRGGSAGAMYRAYPFADDAGRPSHPAGRLDVPEGSRLAIRTPEGVLDAPPPDPIPFTPDREDIVTPDGGMTAWWAVCAARRGVPGYRYDVAP